jgi:hypothetical protein
MAFSFQVVNYTKGYQMFHEKSLIIFEAKLIIFSQMLHEIIKTSMFCTIVIDGSRDSSHGFHGS